MITPLRALLLSRNAEKADQWRRSNQLMDHLEDQDPDSQEWLWYKKHIVKFLHEDLKLESEFSESEIRRAVGLLNVNAVAIRFKECSQDAKGL